ncbi:MAG TPA: hypothetical protein VME21_11015 [Steroidobacteraceae bacterium]|nr:hypothetical protein [Steroidobacteraceae bacterium]
MISLLRSLLAPLQPASVLFVVILVILYDLFAGGAGPTIILRIVPIFFLLSFLLSYAYALLDSLANGEDQVPVFSLEMFDPLHLRAWIHVGVAYGLCAAALLLGGHRAWPVLGATFCLLAPALLAVVVVSEHYLDVLSPAELFRAIVGLGRYYPVLLGIMASYGVLAFVLSRTPLPSNLLYVCDELLLLSYFCGCGRAVFLARAGLAFEPRKSPERTAARQLRHSVLQRDRFFDELFAYVRSRAYDRVQAPTARWLTELPRERMADEVTVLLERAAQWGDPAGFCVLARCVVRQLIGMSRLELGLGAYKLACDRQATFTLGDERSASVLARFAERAGEREAGQRLTQESVNFS